MSLGPGNWAEERGEGMGKGGGGGGHGGRVVRWRPEDRSWKASVATLKTRRRESVPVREFPGRCSRCFHNPQ